MADSKTSYLIGPNGKVDAYSADDALGLLGVDGYLPAGKSQIEDFQKEQAFHEKFGTTGQQLKTFGEGALQSLTLGLSTPVERAFGVRKEDIKGRQEENPGSHLAGSIAGVAAPVILTAGSSLVPEAAAGAAELTAPALIARAGEATTEGVAGLLGESAKTAVGRILTKAAAAGTGSAIEGTAYGLGQVVHEAALGDPNLTASRIIEEVGLSALLGGGIGAGTGALGQMVGEVAAGPLGKKIEGWANTFEGFQNIKTASGPGKGQAALRGLFKKMSPESAAKLGQEAGELGLVGPLDRAANVFEKSSAMTDEVGPKLGDFTRELDATGDAAPKPIEPILARVRREVLKPLEDNPLEIPTAQKLDAILQAETKRFSSTVGDAEHDLTFSDLHQLRTELGKKIYGLHGVADPDANTLKAALHDFRSIVSDELEKGIEKASLPGAKLSDWKALNRRYQVASTMETISERGMASAGLSGIPLTALLSAGAGLIHGGPLGAAALGAGAILAKRYGPQVLAAGARGVRRLVDEGAAEGLASKTAEAISAAREAGVEGAAQGTSTSLSRAWQKVSETLGDPVGGPTKDLIRDVSQERLGKPGEGTPVETVAALSQLERTNQHISNRIDDAVSALVRGAHGVVREEVAAGVHKAFSKSDEESAISHDKMADLYRQLYGDPSTLQERLGRATAGMDQHAPQTAQALRVALSRSVATIGQGLRPATPAAPLASPIPPSPDQVAAAVLRHEVISKPSRILKLAAAGNLTKAAVDAVGAAHPQQLAAMQQAVLKKLAGHKAPIPYAQRQMISLIMGRDMDGTTTPSAIQAYQAVFTSAPSHAGAGIRPTSKGLEKLHLSNRMRTPAQASAARGSGDE